MKLHGLVGNRAVKRQLEAQANGRGLAHAYILSGPEGSGKHTLARIISAALVCTGGGEVPCGGCAACRKGKEGIHPDVIRVSVPADKREITVGQARQLQRDAYIRPNEADRKVYVIEQADLMNPNAQNALLKLLEEGPDYAAFLLLAENPGALLPTVRSRCETLCLAPVTAAEAEAWLMGRFPGKDRGILHAAAADCGGLLGRAVEALEETAQQRQEIAAQADSILRAMRTHNERLLMETVFPLEKRDREQLSTLFDELILRLRAEVTAEDRSFSPHCAVTAAEQLRKIRLACDCNAAPGHLCGWLCAAFATI